MLSDGGPCRPIALSGSLPGRPFVKARAGLEGRAVGAVDQVPASGVDQEMLGLEQLVEPPEVAGELVGSAVFEGPPGPLVLEGLGPIHPGRSILGRRSSSIRDVA